MKHYIIVKFNDDYDYLNELEEIQELFICVIFSVLDIFSFKFLITLPNFSLSSNHILLFSWFKLYIVDGLYALFVLLWCIFFSFI